MKKVLSILLLLLFVFGCASSKGEEIVLTCKECHIETPGVHQGIDCMACHAPIQDVIVHYENDITVEPSILSCVVCHIVFYPDEKSI